MLPPGVDLKDKLINGGFNRGQGLEEGALPQVLIKGRKESGEVRAQTGDGAALCTAVKAPLINITTV